MTPEPTPARRPIRRLSPGTVERIAAGEVVERPASVVKELVENAVDAGARSVTVRVTAAGRERIEVADDGAGIPPEELELAVERHATSKLAPDGPVETITELGFRGEALAAIGAVARLRLVSRPPGRESAEGISVVGGAVVGRFAAARAPGTTAEVEDLFFNTPARRKFLRSGAGERVEIARTVERLYLARPTVAVRLEADGREVAAYAPTANLTEAAAAVLGPEFRRAAFPVHGSLPGGRLFGVLGGSSVAAATTGSLYIAVNGRAVQSRPIAQAVRAAFGDALPRGRFPTGLLHLELDPARVDANAHPTKREVRFAGERELAEAIRLRVRAALAGTPVAQVLGRSDGPAADDDADLPLAFAPTRTDGAMRALTQRTLAPVPEASAVGVPTSPGRFSLLGAVDRLYWVAATDDGLALVDQHAASERLLFELLRRDGTLARQQLVEPVTLALGSAERTAWPEHADSVRAAGFEVDEFGPSTIRVRAVPTYRGRAARAEAVIDLVRELADGGRPTVPDGLVERRCASIACHAAVRAGDAIAAEELARILEALDGLPERVRTCPHGRPIVVRLPRRRLDGWFLRTGA